MKYSVDPDTNAINVHEGDFSGVLERDANGEYYIDWLGGYHDEDIEDNVIKQLNNEIYQMTKIFNSKTLRRT